MKEILGKITDSLRQLPENERELFLREERKKKKIEMKEIKENL